MSSKNDSSLINIACMGDGGVGKTACTVQFVANHFVEYYDPTIEDSYRKQVCLGNSCHSIEILDTAGQDDFSPLRDSWIRSADAFFLVYSITSRSSLMQLREIVRQIHRTKDEETPNTVIHLIGNKLDLDVDGLREVSLHEAQVFAKEVGASKVSEISAKTRQGLTEAWHGIVAEIVGKDKNVARKNASKRKAANACTIL